MFNDFAWNLCKMFWDVCSTKAFEAADVDIDQFIYWEGLTKEAEAQWDKLELIIYPLGVDGLHSWEL